jgi:pimeloyl-ACP methyl ester carboxylesterase
MQIEKIHVNVITDDGSSVHAQVLSPSRVPLRETTIIFSHGFTTTGTEGGRRFVNVANTMLASGYHCVLFDYRGWGYSDLATEQMTFATQLEDLNSVINYVHEKFPRNRLVLLGNSLGSAVASHVASERADISLIVLWCLSADLYNRYEDRLGPEIKSKGFTYNDGYKIGLAFLQSLIGRDTFAAIRDARVPCLLVHGDADTTAPIELSRRAHRIASKTTTLVEIAEAGHSFCSPPESLEMAKKVTLSWLNERIEPQ